MNEFFLKIFNMSISASWIILVVLVLRLLLKKAPKWINVLLWGIVAVRLICPFTIESVMSLMPSAEAINPQTVTSTPAINTGIPSINNTLNPIIQESTIAVSQEESINILQILISVFSKVWIIGIVLMLAYSVVSYIRIKRKIGTAVLLRDNIYQSEAVISPFVLGLVKPKIYLPFNICKQDIAPVIKHEQSHIHRKDYLWKPLGFLLLTLHWFNPIVWLGYILLCRDIELACDERVIKEMTKEQRADYSQTLLSCSVNRRIIAACPIAFGEVNVKNRIKNVLNYKKTTFWIIIVAIIASIIVAACFLTNPENSEDSSNESNDTNTSTNHNTEARTDTNTSIDISDLKAKYPIYFDLDTTKGLTVYIWQMSANSYSCGLLPNSNIGHTELELLKLDSNATSIDEMKRIITYYYPKNTEKYVTICPIIMPISSYTYNIDDIYIHKINELFFGKDIAYQMPTYENIYDAMSFDIDDDGIIEDCFLGYGPSSGIYTFTFSVYEDGKLEYFNIFSSLRVYDIYFNTNENGQVQLFGTHSELDSEPYTQYMSMAIDEGNICIFSDEQDISYWGEQGINSPFAPN